MHNEELNNVVEFPDEVRLRILSEARTARENGINMIPMRADDLELLIAFVDRMVAANHHFAHEALPSAWYNGSYAALHSALYSFQVAAGAKFFDVFSGNYTLIQDVLKGMMAEVKTRAEAESVEIREYAAGEGDQDDEA